MIIVNQEDEIFIKTGENTFTKFTGKQILENALRKPSRSRRSKSPDGLLRRKIGLLVNGIIKGKWSTGAPINREDYYDKLVTLLVNGQVTEKVHSLLLPLLTGPHLSDSKKSRIMEILQRGEGYATPA